MFIVTIGLDIVKGVKIIVSIPSRNVIVHQIT